MGDGYYGVDVWRGMREGNRAIGGVADDMRQDRQMEQQRRAQAIQLEMAQMQLDEAKRVRGEEQGLRDRLSNVKPTYTAIPAPAQPTPNLYSAGLGSDYLAPQAMPSAPLPTPSAPMASAGGWQGAAPDYLAETIGYYERTNPAKAMEYKRMQYEGLKTEMDAVKQAFAMGDGQGAAEIWNRGALGKAYGKRSYIGAKGEYQFYRDENTGEVTYINKNNINDAGIVPATQGRPATGKKAQEGADATFMSEIGGLTGPSAIPGTNKSRQGYAPYAEVESDIRGYGASTGASADAVNKALDDARSQYEKTYLPPQRLKDGSMVQYNLMGKQDVEFRPPSVPAPPNPERQFSTWVSKLQDLKGRVASVQKGVDPITGAAIPQPQVEAALNTLLPEIQSTEAYIRANFPAEWGTYRGGATPAPPRQAIPTPAKGGKGKSSGRPPLGSFQR